MPIHIPYTPNPQLESTYQNRGRRGRPLLFQITDPRNLPLYPYALALHVNPANLSERMNKSKTVAMTKGGFVEWQWPDDLDGLSASGSTGAFIGPDTGLISGSDGRRSSSNLPVDSQIITPGRKQTIAWERQEDLLELFHNNGKIYNAQGIPVLRGRVMMIYDRGIYSGHFTTFSVKETDEKAYSFELTWDFKVESSLYIFPNSASKFQPAENPFAKQAQIRDDVGSGPGIQINDEQGEVESAVDPLKDPDDPLYRPNVVITPEDSAQIAHDLGFSPTSPPITIEEARELDKLEKETSNNIEITWEAREVRGVLR